MAKASENQSLPHKKPGLPLQLRRSSLGTRLFVVIASLLIVGVLMRMLAQHVWLNNIGGWQDSEFDAAASRFQSHVMLAHVEWIRLGEPAQVSLNVRGDELVTVPMGSNGWPVITGTEQRSSAAAADLLGAEFCYGIWVILAEPGNLRRKLTAEYETAGPRSFCYFYYDGVLRFRYQPSNGQIYHEPKP